MELIGLILFIAICIGVYLYIKRDPKGGMVEGDGPGAIPGDKNDIGSKL